MSFPKAKVKRFNELDGCGPPVGSYDPKLNDVTTTPLFLRSERFKQCSESLESSISSFELSAKKSTGICFKKPNFPKRQPIIATPVEYIKVQECEKEIRRLLKERSDLLKQLSSKEEEMKKLEGKLQAVIRERSHFQANMATVEKEAKELRRANDILKMKVNTLEGVSKTKDLRVELANLRAGVIEKEHVMMDLKQELTSIKQEHENCYLECTDKDNEIKRVKNEMTLAINNLKEELEHTNDHIFELEMQKNNLVDDNDKISSEVHHLQNKIINCESTIRDLSRQKELLNVNLKEYSEDLEIKKQEMNQIVEELRKENLALVSRIEDQTNRRQSKEKILSTELDNAYQKLSVTEDCSRALQEYRDVLSGRVEVLKDCVDELEGQQSFDIKTIKELKLELIAATARLEEKEQALNDANKNVFALNETINELKSAHDQLQSMTEKCIYLEEELSCRDDEHKVHVDKLEVEVLVTKLSYEVGEQELTGMRQQLSELQASLDKEQHVCKQLQAEIKQQKYDSCETVTKLNNEIIRVQNECQAKVEQIERLEGVIATHSSQIEVLANQREQEIGEKNKLQKLNDKQSLQLSQLENQFEIAKQEKLQLDTALQSSNFLLTSLRDEFSAEKRTMDNEMVILRNVNEEKYTEICILLSKETVHEAQVNDYMASLSVVNAKVIKVQQENEELISVLACKEVAAKELENAINDYEVKLSTNQLEKNTLDESNKNFAQQLENIEAKYADHMNLYEETKEENKQKSELLETLHAECETVQVMFSELYEEKNGIEMEFRKLSRQLFDSSKDLTSEKDKCIELKGKLHKKTCDVKTLSEKLQESEEKCNSLQMNIVAAEKRNGMLEDMCQKLENQIDDAQENLATVEHEMQVQLSTLSEHVEHVLMEKRETESFLSEVRNAEKVLQEELSCTLEKMHSLAFFLESSKADVVDLQAEVDLLRNSSVEKEQAVIELSSSILQSQTQIEALMIDIEKKDEVISNMKCVTVKLENELQNALGYKNLTSDLQKELTCTIEELHKLKLHIENSTSQISTLQSEVDALSSCIVEKEHIILKQDADYDAMNKAIDVLNDQLNNKDETINCIKGECDILQESLKLRYEEIAELKSVIETNKQLISEARDNSIIEDLHNATSELDSLYETCQGQQELIKKMNSEKEDLKNRIKQLETEVETQSAQTHWLVDREKKLQRELDVVEEHANLQQQEYIRVLRETQKQYAQLESERYKKLKESEGRQNEEMLQALTNEYENRAQLLSQHIEQLKNESLSWKSQFEDLQAKVAPFQDQLDAFEVERNMMMSKTNETLSDFQKLSQQYATLLGHQNHKQKIQHVCKLKEEILSLKDEKAKLTSENMKLKKQVQRRDGGNIPSSVRKFDPSKAFQHPNKENDASLQEFQKNTRQF